MKKTMFKIAGVKNDKQFYAKYPTEEDFMAKHGAEFKAKFGGKFDQAQFGALLKQAAPMVAGLFGNKGESAAKIGQNAMAGFGGVGAVGAGAAQSGVDAATGGGLLDKMGGVTGIANAAGGIIDAFQGVKAAKEAKNAAIQGQLTSRVSKDAALSTDVDARNQRLSIAQNKYEDVMRPINAEELHPGEVGTNILAAQDGVAIHKKGGRKIAPGRLKVLEEKEAAKKTRDSLFDVKLKAISKEPGFKEYMKNKKAQDGVEAPVQYLDEVNVRSNRAVHLPNYEKGSEEQLDALDAVQQRMKLSNEQMGGFQDQRVSDRDWESRKQQYFKDEFTNWRSGKTGHSPNNKFNQSSPEYMGAWKSIKEKWHKENPRQINPIVQDYSTQTHKIRNENGEMQLGGMINGLGGNLADGIFGDSAAGNLGNAIGSAIPIPGMGLLGEGVGRLIGAKGERQTKLAQNETERNMATMSNLGQASRIHGMNSSFMADGGEVTNMEGDGSIQMLGNGGLKTISVNPHTVGAETNKFTGKSHGEGGENTLINGRKVEVEPEPVMKMNDENGGEKITVFGKVKMSEDIANMIGDPDAKNKSFKSYIDSQAKKETKINTTMRNAESKLSKIETRSYKFDRLKEATQKIRLKGGDLKLQSIAEKKENAANAQEAILSTAEEVGVDPNVLTNKNKYDNWLKKKFPENKKLFGEPKSELAQDGKTITSDKKQEYLDQGWKIDPKNPSRLYKDGKDPIKVAGIAGIEGGTETKVIQEATAPIKDTYDGKGGYANNEDWTKFLNSPKGAAYKAKYLDGTPEVVQQIETQGLQGMDSFELPGAPPQEMFIKDPETGKSVPVKNKKGFNPVPYLGAISSIFGRGSDAEGLNANQLWGEMFAMSNNHEEPVQATSYQPKLDVPYDISLQDQLNRNTSNIRAASRMAQGNPAAQAMLQAQAYSQDQPILAEQFRQNQNMKNQVYNKNRATLNDAQLKNIDIYDRQYVRQSQAKSNTKEAAQNAINSISDKYQRNQLEQRTLKTYENLYNYRFGNDYRAQNVNDAVDWKGRIDQALSKQLGIPAEELDKKKAAALAKAKKEQAEKAGDMKGTDFNPDLQSRFGSMTRALKKF